VVAAREHSRPDGSTPSRGEDKLQPFLIDRQQIDQFTVIELVQCEMDSAVDVIGAFEQRRERRQNVAR